ncbi:hypothetical protein ACFFRR_007327 [Megaselia abdita]
MESGPKWNSLPTEICEKIFESLDVASLKNVSLVCSQWSYGSEILISKRTVLECHKVDEFVDFTRIRSRNLLMDCDGNHMNLKQFIKILRSSNVSSVIIQNYPFYEDGIRQVHILMNILRKKLHVKQIHWTATKRSPEVIKVLKNIDFNQDSFSMVQNLALSHPGDVFNPYLQFFTNIKALKIQHSKAQKDYEAIIHLIKLNQKTLESIELENCVSFSFKVIISIMNLEGLRKFSLKHCSGAYIIVSKLLDKYGNSNILEYFDIENYQYEGINHYGSVHHHIIK